MSTTGPQQVWTTVGVTGLRVYPYGGPYDATTVETLGGLETLDFGQTTTLAEGWGGESPLLLFSAETKRDIEIKASAFQITLRLAQILLGGSLAVDGQGTAIEKQYYASTFTGRAQYFRLEADSNNGDGTAKLVFPKVKINATLGWNLRKDTVNVFEFSGKPHFDKTYVCQNGQVGAIFDWYFGYGANNTSPMS